MSHSVERAAFFRPLLSLLSAIAAALLGIWALYLDTEYTVSTKWLLASLLLNAGAVAFGVAGNADGARGRAAFAASVTLVAGTVVLYLLMGSALITAA
jgi:hypothetical protein